MTVKFRNVSPTAYKVAYARSRKDAEKQKRRKDVMAHFLLLFCCCFFLSKNVTPKAHYYGWFVVACPVILFLVLLHQKQN